MSLKPGDFFKGMRVTLKNWGSDDFITVTAIGRDNFLAIDKANFESRWTYSEFIEWHLQFALPTKRKVKVAPAICGPMTNGLTYPSELCYSSVEEAQKNIGRKFLHWPAFEPVEIEITDANEK